MKDNFKKLRHDIIADTAAVKNVLMLLADSLDEEALKNLSLESARRVEKIQSDFLNLLQLYESSQM